MTEQSTPDSFAPLVAACGLAIGVFHLLNVAGVLLLMAMVGAIAIAQKRFPGDGQASTAALGEVGRRAEPF